MKKVKVLKKPKFDLSKLMELYTQSADRKITPAGAEASNLLTKWAYGAFFAWSPVSLFENSVAAWRSFVLSNYDRIEGHWADSFMLDSSFNL